MCSEHPTTYTPRHVLDLIEWLPDTSAFVASKHGGVEFVGWGYDRVMRVRQYEAININSYLTARAAAGKKGKRMRAPKPVPTPFKKSIAAARKPKLSLAQFAQRLSRQHPRG